MRILLFVLTVALILYGSFYPWNFAYRPLDASPLWILLHSWPRSVDRGIVRDIGVNLALYVPFGISAYLLLSKVRSRWVRYVLPVVVGMLLSAFIEMAQLFDYLRVCSVVDLICNTLGAAAGVLLMGALHAHMRSEVVQRLLRRPDAAVLLSGWIFWQIFPLFPIWRASQFPAKLLAVAHSGVHAAELMTAIAGWFVFATVLDILLPEFARTTIVTFLVVTPAVRLFIYGRTVTISELAGAGAAVLFWLFVHRDRRRLAISCCVLTAVALVVRELSPFEWTATTGPFAWTPFTASLESDSLEGLIVFVEKSFVYAAAIWAAWQAGLRLRTATIAVAVLLLLLELAQRHIPNRSPESTDALMAIIAGFVLNLAAPGGTLTKDRPLVVQELTTKST